MNYYNSDSILKVYWKTKLTEETAVFTNKEALLFTGSLESQVNTIECYPLYVIFLYRE